MSTTQDPSGTQHSIGERIDRLPTLPSTVVELVSLDPNHDDYPQHVQSVVERDPSLAARVLSWANSATSGPKQPITALPQAIMRMGAKKAAQLITSMAVMRIFVPGTEDLRNLWRHALQTATAARDMAVAAGNGVHPQQAYLVGLLHDIGRFVMFGTLTDAMKKLEHPGWQGAGIHGLERGQMGYDHAEIGWYACTSWGFPSDLAAVIQAHHDAVPSPQQLPAHLVPLLRVVQQADQLSLLLLGDRTFLQQTPAQRKPALEAACICPAWERPPLSVEQIDPLIASIHSSSQEAMQSLGIAPA